MNDLASWGIFVMEAGLLSASVAIWQDKGAF